MIPEALRSSPDLRERQGRTEEQRAKGRTCRGSDVFDSKRVQEGGKGLQ